MSGDGLRDEVQDLIDDGLSRIYGTFVDSTTPGHLAHLLAPLVAAGVQAHVDAAREQVAEQIAQAIEAEYVDSPWIRTAIDIARRHAKEDRDV